MSEIVEGYRAPASKNVDGASSWIHDLRGEARREMIRELTLRRIHSGARSEPSSVGPTRTEKFLEGIIIGVGVAVVSTWVCRKIGLAEK